MTPDEMQQVNDRMRQYEARIDAMAKAMADAAAKEMPPVIKLNMNVDGIAAAIVDRVLRGDEFRNLTQMVVNLNEIAEIQNNQLKTKTKQVDLLVAQIAILNDRINRLEEGAKQQFKNDMENVTKIMGMASKIDALISTLSARR